MPSLTPGGDITAHPRVPNWRPQPCLPHPTLDRDAVRRGIVRRRQCLAELETALVAACEAAALRASDSRIRGDDRATWDHATWQRYLDAAARLEPEYGPRMRRLLQDIDRLTRLLSLPVATSGRTAQRRE
jgi:hypothetical protein